MDKIICNQQEPEVLKICSGNDFSLRIYCTQYDKETDSWINYDLNTTSDLQVYLVSTQFKRIKMDHIVNGDGSVTVDVLSNYLQTTTYGVEITFKNSNKRNKRTYTPIMLQIVRTTEEAQTDISEYENATYDLNIKIYNDLDLIKIGGGEDINDYVTVSYLEQNYYSRDDINANYYDKSTIDDYYYDTNEIDNILTSYATTDYVDTKFSQIPTVDLSSYATIQYVDNAISALPSVDLSSYVTNTELDDTLSSYATKSYVDMKINEIPQADLSAYVSHDYLSQQSYITNNDLNSTLTDYATTNYVDTAISEIPQVDLSSYVTNTELDNTLSSYATHDYVDTAISEIPTASGVQFAPDSPQQVSYVWAGTNEQLSHVAQQSSDTLYITTDDEQPEVDLTPYATIEYVNETVPKIVHCTQAQYDALVSAGTVNATTIYFIDMT